ncbi:hypothetical protein EJB05_07882, partial [Eragrostis curvula]
VIYGANWLLGVDVDCAPSSTRLFSGETVAIMVHGHNLRSIAEHKNLWKALFM